MRMQLGARLFDGPGPFIMGIVNATPDSFSDGGRYLEPAAAIAHALRLVDEGADLVDVGGESTRPGSAAVTPEEEIARVVPVIAGVRARGCRVPVSIDTTKPEVARAALEAGADVVNDVSCLADPELARVTARAGVPLVLQHARGAAGAPAAYGDVVAEVARELRDALARAEAAGIARDRVILDPGIGFAKQPADDVALLAGLPVLRALGRPLLVGPSRKKFIGALTGAPVGDRVPGTLAAVTACVLAGVEWVRVHDVAPARQAALVAAAIRDAAARRVR